MDPEVIYYFDNTLCGDISTPVTGQLGLDLMVNPPQSGDPSYHTYMQVRKQQKPTVVLCYTLTFNYWLFCSQRRPSSSWLLCPIMLNGFRSS